jgi:uncharacterized protein YecT (DUF1311 family)
MLMMEVFSPRVARNQIVTILFASVFFPFHVSAGESVSLQDPPRKLIATPEEASDVLSFPESLVPLLYAGKVQNVTAPMRFFGEVRLMPETGQWREFDSYESFEQAFESGEPWSFAVLAESDAATALRVDISSTSGSWLNSCTYLYSTDGELAGYFSSLHTRYGNVTVNRIYEKAVPGDGFRRVSESIFGLYGERLLEDPSSISYRNVDCPVHTTLSEWSFLSPLQAVANADHEVEWGQHMAAWPASAIDGLLLETMAVASICDPEKFELALVPEHYRSTSYLKVLLFQDQVRLGCEMDHGRVEVEIDVYPPEAENYYCAGAMRADLDLKLNNETVFSQPLANYCTLQGVTSLTVEEGVVEYCGFEGIGESLQSVCYKRGAVIEDGKTRSRTEAENAALSTSRDAAGGVHRLDQELDECIDANPDSSFVRRCYERFVEEWDHELNRVYQLLRDGYRSTDPVQLEPLKAAQLAWLRFRDSEFRYIEAKYDKDGTMYERLIHMEKMQIVRQRALTLGRYYDVLSTML